MPWDAVIANRSVAPPRSVLKDEVLADLRDGKIVASVAPTIPGISSDNFVAFVLDLVWAAVDGALPPDKLVEGLRAAGPQLDAGAVLDSVFWVVWTDIVGDKSAGPRVDDYDSNQHVTLLVDVIKACLGAQLVDKTLLMSTHEPYLLYQVGSIEPPDEKRNYKFVSKCTSIANLRGAKLYRFNTFREESEGYSKLLTLLYNDAVARVDDTKLLKEVTKLIGCFDLCPNKALDCILGAVAFRPDRAQVLLKLAALGHASAGNALMTLRMREVVADSSKARPYFGLAAVLLQAGVVAPADLLAVVAGDLPALKSAFAAALRPEALRASRVAATADRGPRSDCDFAVDVTSIDVAAADAIGFSRPLVLLQMLLERSAWSIARTLLHALTAASGASPVAHRHVGVALLATLDTLLAPAHAALFPRGPMGACLLPPLDQSNPGRAPRKLAPAAPLSAEVVQVLHWLGPYGFRCPRVLTCLLRVLRHVMLTHPPQSTPFLTAVRVLRECAFPSVLLVQNNQAVSLLAWGCVGILPYEGRFALYNYVKQLREAAMPAAASGPGAQGASDVPRVPLIKVQWDMVEDEFRRVVRRMTLPSDLEARERVVNENARMVAKLAAGSPFVVAETVRWNAMNYSNLHETLVEAQRLLPALQLDVVLHALLSTLTSSSPPRINPSDNTNLSEWLVHVSAFLTSFVSRYPVCDLSALCQYIYLRLRSGDACEVIILHDLLTHLLGIHVVSELSRDQLMALPGSDMLRAVSLMTPLSATEDFQRAQSLRLLGAMQGAADPRRHLTAPIFITLCQLRHILCSEFASDKVKLISELYDRTQTTLQQYLRFLHLIPEADYLKVALPLEQLCEELQLDKESVMTLYRPILRKALEGWDGSFVPVPALSAPADGNGALAATNGDASPPPHSLQGLVAAVHRLMPQEYKASLGSFNPAFYVLFWALDLHDLEHPETSYKEHLDALQRQKRELEGRITSMTRLLEEQRRRKEHNSGYGGGYSGRADPVTVNAHEITALEQELAQVARAAAVMPVQQASHAAHVQRMHAMLESGKATYFIKGAADGGPDGAPPLRDDVKEMKTNMWLLLQECVLPRCLNSYEDALYCACFLNHVFKLRVPGFNYVSLLDTVFKEVITLMSCITDREAQLLVVFVRQLAMLLEPLNDPVVYERDMANSDACRSSTKADGAGPRRQKKVPVFVDYAGWCKLTSKWQDRVCSNLAKMMQSSLDTSVRNALKMAQDLLPFIPSTPTAFTRLDSAITELLRVVSEDKQDIKQLALAAQRQLENVRKACMADGRAARGGTSPERGSQDREVDESPKPARGRGAMRGTDLRPDAKDFVPRADSRAKAELALEAGELEAGEVADDAAPRGAKGARRGDDAGDDKAGRKRRADAAEPGDQQARQRPRQDAGGGTRGAPRSPRRDDRYDDSNRAGAPNRRTAGGGMRSDAYQGR